MTLEEIQIIINLLINEESREVYKSNINKAIQLENLRNKFKALINHSDISNYIVDGEYKDIKDNQESR